MKAFASITKLSLDILAGSNVELEKTVKTALLDVGGFVQDNILYGIVVYWFGLIDVFFPSNVVMTEIIGKDRLICVIVESRNIVVDIALVFSFVMLIIEFMLMPEKRCHKSSIEGVTGYYIHTYVGQTV